MLGLIFSVITGYLLGSIPTSIAVGKILRGVDVRDYGSGNAGFTNAYRVLGLWPAIFVLAVDVLKGAAAVIVASQVAHPDWVLSPASVKVIAGIAAILGHIWTVFAGFRGGKGVATTAGVLAALTPLGILVALAIWGLVVLSTRYVSLGSITAAVSIPIFMVIQKFAVHRDVPPEILAFTFLIGVLIIFTHRSNIRRLLRGEEHKFQRRGSPGGGL